MNESSTAAIPARRPRFSTRKLVHMSMLLFAFLLPYLTWLQAAGCAVLALLFNLYVLPNLNVNLSKRASGAREMGEGPVIQPGETSPRSGAGSPGPADAWTGIVFYPLSVLGLILFYSHRMHIVAAAWAIMAMGDGWASVAGETLGGPTLIWNRTKTWWGFSAFIVAGGASAYILTRWVAPSLSSEKVLVVSLAASLAAAFVEAAPMSLDDNLSVPLVSGGFMFCAYLVERSALESNLPYLSRRIVIGVSVNLAFALVAWGLKMVDRSGAFAGFLLGTAVYLGYGYKSFLILLSFFALGSLATRLGYAKKAARGIAERRGGARSWREALANSLAGAFFSILVITTHHETAFLAALLAAFAEAAGDTVSSEIGQWLSDRAYLITNLTPLPAGENGGITFAGTLAGLVASVLVGALGYTLKLCGPGLAAIAVAAGLAGNLFDSLLGATLERRGMVTNGIVNFAGTSFAGALALMCAFEMGF